MTMLADGAREALALFEIEPAADRAAALWDLHHEFEHIHPFFDGNGRTGRLWLNALRLAAGLPWLTVWAADRQRYYAAIRAWELAHA